jgi:hypothetical protein
MKQIIFAAAVFLSGAAFAQSQSPDLNQLEALLGRPGNQEPILLVCAATDGNSACDDRVDTPCCDQVSVCVTSEVSHYGLCD